MITSAGTLFRSRIEEESPLQVLGCINAYTALMAEQNGAKSIYLSGAGVANTSFGLPDLGITALGDLSAEGWGFYDVLFKANHIYSTCGHHCSSCGFDAVFRH